MNLAHPESSIITDRHLTFINLTQQSCIDTFLKTGKIDLLNLKE